MLVIFRVQLVMGWLSQISRTCLQMLISIDPNDYMHNFSWKKCFVFIILLISQLSHYKPASVILFVFNWALSFFLTILFITVSNTVSYQSKCVWYLMCRKAMATVCKAFSSITEMHDRNAIIWWQSLAS